jgi:hypothetical protein
MNKFKQWLIQVASGVAITLSAQSYDTHWYIWLPLAIAGFMLMDLYADERVKEAMRGGGGGCSR